MVKLNEKASLSMSLTGFACEVMFFSGFGYLSMSLVPNLYSFLALVFVRLYEKFMFDYFLKLWQGLQEH